MTADVPSKPYQQANLREGHLPDTHVLLVLAIQEAGLRSALAAQLAMSGASLITTSDIDNPALLRGVRRPPVLVIDRGTLAVRAPGWLEVALEESRWLQIVLLTETRHDEPATSHAKLLRLEPKQAVRALGEKIPHWREELAP